MSCPCCCCHVLCCYFDHDLCLCRCGSFGGHCCCLSLISRYSWHALKPSKPPKLSTSLTFRWFEKWTSHSFSNLDLPDLDVKELCLEILRALARSTPGFLPEFGMSLMPQACCMSSLSTRSDPNAEEWSTYRACFPRCLSSVVRRLSPAASSCKATTKLLASMASYSA